MCLKIKLYICSVVTALNELNKSENQTRRSESSHASVQGMKRSTMALKPRTDVKYSPNKHIIDLRNE